MRKVKKKGLIISKIKCQFRNKKDIFVDEDPTIALLTHYPTFLALSWIWSERMWVRWGVVGRSIVLYGNLEGNECDSIRKRWSNSSLPPQSNPVANCQGFKSWLLTIGVSLPLLHHDPTTIFLIPKRDRDSSTPLEEWKVKRDSS